MATSWDEIKARSEAWDREHPWLRRWYRFVGWAWRHEGWLNPRDWYHSVKWFIQRGRRGWSDRDVWGFDTYLARVIAEGVEHLIETKHGYQPICPVNVDHLMGTAGEEQDYSPNYCAACQMQYSEEAVVEAFNDELREVAKVFRDYITACDVLLHGDEWEKLMVRMQKFIKHFSALWD